LQQLYITSALLFISSFYTSSILLGRLADPDLSRRLQVWLYYVQLANAKLTGTKIAAKAGIFELGLQIKVLLQPACVEWCWLFCLLFTIIFSSLTVKIN
jgi:hypothetical protein